MKDKVLQKNRTVYRRIADNGLLKSGLQKGIVHCCAVGLLISVIMGVFLAFIMSWIICETADPARYVTPTALIALYVSAFFGGFSAVILNKKANIKSKHKSFFILFSYYDFSVFNVQCARCHCKAIIFI